jgi:hypothetical protein
MWVVGAPFFTFLSLFPYSDVRGKNSPMKQPKSVGGLGNTWAVLQVCVVTTQGFLPYDKMGQSVSGKR